MKTISISEETYEAIKGQLEEEEKIDVNSYKDLIGKKLFIRTVTYHLTGKVEKVMGNFLQLSTAAWVADSGRFMQAIENGELKEAINPNDKPWFYIRGHKPSSFQYADRWEFITDMKVWHKVRKYHCKRGSIPRISKISTQFLTKADLKMISTLLKSIL